jgi:hypothetical protein
MTSLQTRLIHIAAKQVDLSDLQYRLLLKNVAGVDSSKMLTQAGFEDVMAVLEDMGFRDTAHAPARAARGDYWRGKVAVRGQQCGGRMVHKIRELAERQSKYTLIGLCHLASQYRAADPEHLRPREAWNLIEMLKDVIKRTGNQPALFPPATSNQQPATSPATSLENGVSHAPADAIPF